MSSGPRTAGVLALFTALVAVGLASVWLASRPPAIGPAVGDPALIAVGLGAGVILGGAGCLALVAYPSERFGWLAIGAALAWFAAGWLSPGTGSPILFTTGLVLTAACPAIVAHAGLGYRTSSIDRRTQLIVVVGYLICIVLVGLVPATLRSSDALCAACPTNLVVLVAAPDAGRLVGSAGLALAVAWAAIAITVGSLRLVRATPARRRGILPVSAPALAVVGLFGVDAATSVRGGAIVVGPLATALWALEAAALIALGLGSVARIVRSRQTRAAVADIVLDLAGSTGGAGLEGRLRVLLGDPSLVLVYRTRDGRLVDVMGSPWRAADAPGRRSTPLARGGETVALIEHERDLDLDADRMSEIVNAASLALEHERLIAESRAHLADLRASRSRVVEAGDRERRRLERDLHDGTQQRLVSLSVGLRLARAHASAAPSPVTAGIETAEEDVRAAILEVRDIGHGIYPAILADMGLAAAVEALAEASPIQLAVEAMPAGRFKAAVESTAYFLVSETPAIADAGRAKVRGEVIDGLLRIDLDLDAVAPVDATYLPELEDRIGAINGRLDTAAEGGLFRVSAEIPCAS